MIYLVNDISAALHIIITNKWKQSDIDICYTLPEYTLGEIFNQMGLNQFIHVIILDRPGFKFDISDLTSWFECIMLSDRNCNRYPAAIRNAMVEYKIMNVYFHKHIDDSLI